jgi:O-antigen biosynthesis protein WbqP
MSLGAVTLIVDRQQQPTPQVAGTPPQRPFGLLMKRVTDVSIAGGTILVMSPVFAIIALAIRLDSPGPAIFKQKRIGLNGELFEIWKYRTMYVGTPNVATDLMVKMAKSPITRVGAFLRKTSLDELPQLWNVLRGEMSLVGPRPALYNQYDLTDKRRAANALCMAPGITGWAQVNGRDELPDDEKVAFDAWYCAQWHYLLDWQIIFKTIGEVVRRRGAW